MVKGLRRFKKRLTRDVPEAVREAAKKALAQGAAELVAEMKRRAPVESGDLRESIGWTWGDAPKGAMVIGEVRNPASKGDLRITIYAGGGDVYYHWFQEFGTKNMPANPFFFPTYRGQKRRVKGRVTRAINKAIRES